MDEKLSGCTIYIDFQGLAVGLSQRQYWNVQQVIPHLLAKAADLFQVKHIYAFGDWSSLGSRLTLESMGIVCLLNQSPGTAPVKDIQGHITDKWNRGGKITDIYLIVGGNTDYSPILRQLNSLDKKSVVWTASPLSADERALCSDWGIISLPDNLQANAWPRQVMVHAVALVADQLTSDDDPLFLMNHLLNHLQMLSPFENSAETWLDIALRERVIFLQGSTSLFESAYGRLNRHSPIAQKAFQIQERILSVLSVMIANREWVAFSALEKVLRTAKPLAGSQQLRHAWLEMLSDMNFLTLEKLQESDAPYPTTTIKPNQHHPAVIAATRRQENNLVRLVVAADNFMKRKQSGWIAISKLLEIMTESSTRVEARAALDLAKAREVVALNAVANKHNVDYSVSALQLDYEHSFVQAALSMRDYIIFLAYHLLALPEFLSSDIGISQDILENELIVSGKVEENLANFWIDLLVKERILSQVTFISAPAEAIPLLSLKMGDPIINQILATLKRQQNEVQR